MKKAMLLCAALALLSSRQVFSEEVAAVEARREQGENLDLILGELKTSDLNFTLESFGNGAAGVLSSSLIGTSSIFLIAEEGYSASSILLFDAEALVLSGFPVTINLISVFQKQKIIKDYYKNYGQYPYNAARINAGELALEELAITAKNARIINGIGLILAGIGTALAGSMDSEICPFLPIEEDSRVSAFFYCFSLTMIGVGAKSLLIPSRDEIGYSKFAERWH